MTKTLSEQLCEIVGLPYEKKIYFRNPGIEEVLYKCTYLDFEQPKNFVKLLELEIKPSKSLLWWCINKNSIDNKQTPPYYRLTFLIKLKFLLEDPFKLYHPKTIEQIKQSIRDYDGWVWG